ncbi:MAG TPA: trehalose-phosphatase [Gemmatimonadales bacterium]|jgi:trehalose 6-phosphate phosphatase|nr:trehalose-phosphatase [Gemmatimonadales bacterium]
MKEGPGAIELPSATRPPPAGGLGWAYFFDLDGTLVELVDPPAVVRVDPALRDLLAALRGATGGAVALISGRSLDGLDLLFPGPPFPAAGQHGLERRGADGRITRHPPPEGLDAARRVLTETGDPRIEIEDKGLSIALHYRLAPKLGGYAGRLARAAARAAGPLYAVLPGKRIVEIKPAGRDKGLAVREFLEEPPFRGMTPLFVGDDVTDEQGFETVNAAGGVSIKVGAGDTVARWHLRDVRAVRAWMARAIVAARSA